MASADSQLSTADLRWDRKHRVICLHFFEETIGLLHDVVRLVHFLSLLPLLLVVGLESLEEATVAGGVVLSGYSDSCVVPLLLLHWLLRRVEGFLLLGTGRLPLLSGDALPLAFGVAMRHRLASRVHSSDLKQRSVGLTGSFFYWRLLQEAIGNRRSILEGLLEIQVEKSFRWISRHRDEPSGGHLVVVASISCHVVISRL